MTDNHEHPVDIATADRQRRIDDVLSAFLEPGSAELPSQDELTKLYPELMPELGSRTRAMESIRLAKAKATYSSSNIDGSGHPQEEVAFLQESLPDLRILCRLASGGQGVVYKAQQITTKRIVALKVLLDGPLATAKQRLRFAREAELVSRLSHPNIVTLHNAGEVHGRPYAIMEFIDGLPIDDYIVLHDASIHDVVQLFVSVCSAVHFAHQRGVIHRDLKPSNILVDNEGKPFVLDFGLAKAYSDAQEDGQFLSMEGQVVGTLPYLAPEQALGNADEVDVRSDVYALGIVLYELITRSYPYTVAGNRLEAIKNITDAEPIPLRKSLSQDQFDRPGALTAVNDDLEAVVAKALEKDKERRYQSASAFSDDLRRYLCRDAVEAKARRKLYVLRKSARRHRLPIIIASTLLAAIFASMSWAWQHDRQVAHDAMAALQLGAYLRHGSVRRDEGRVQQAVELLEAAIEIGNRIRRPTAPSHRFMYDAHYSLAEIYNEKREFQLSEEHTDIARELAKQLVDNSPDDPEWQRQWGFTLLLSGRLAYARKDWELALKFYRETASIRQKLVTADPNNNSYLGNLAVAWISQGRALKKLKKTENARLCFVEALDIYVQLSEKEPDEPEYVLNLARAEGELASVDLKGATAEQLTSSMELLKSAHARLQQLNKNGHIENSVRVGKLLDAINKNISWIGRHIPNE